MVSGRWLSSSRASRPRPAEMSVSHVADLVHGGQNLRVDVGLGGGEDLVEVDHGRAYLQVAGFIEGIKRVARLPKIVGFDVAIAAPRD